MSNIKQAMKGDKQAFVKVIEEHKLALYKVMKAILQNEDDVCDAICLYTAYFKANQKELNWE